MKEKLEVRTDALGPRLRQLRRSNSGEKPTKKYVDKSTELVNVEEESLRTTS